MYALIDCNNFFASCEQVFNPHYRNRPLVVLSNNDGCVVARSKEAKALGIPMGVPAFECKSLFLQHDVIVLSSNFVLYGDMSKRVIETIKTFGLPIEIYSIDEAFVTLPVENPLPLAWEIRQKILQWTGLSVSIGIAPTKTLAKVANHAAKKGIRVILYQQELLHNFPVADIWGIGRRLAKRLYQEKIRYAHELIQRDESWIRQKLSVIGLRTVMELKGISCLETLEILPERKSIVSSRSFGKKVNSLEELKEAVATFVARAACKLRRDKLKAYFLLVFIESELHRSHSAAVHLPFATSYTPDLISYAHTALETLYQEGVFYRRAGVMLSELIAEEETQLDLFRKEQSTAKKKRAIEVLDAINQHYQHKALIFAAEGIAKKWQGASEKRSPHYTTSWDDLLKIEL